MQSIFLCGAWVLLGIASSIMQLVLGHIPVLGVVVGLLLGLVWLVLGLGGFVVYLITIIKAFSGVEWEIPFLGPMARKQLASSNI
jgi:uncharacterized membrane protein